jgi:farnesol dehydrogenase
VPLLVAKKNALYAQEKLNMSNVFVTGGTGFIGQRLVQLLTKRGDTVHMLCRPTADTVPSGTTNPRIFYGDILDPSSIERAMAGCTRIFHLAGYARNWAKDPHAFVETNVNGTKNLLDAAQKMGVEKIVCTSTSVTLGPSNGAAVDESAKRTVDFFTDYERSKFMTEEAILSYTTAGLHVVIVNPTRVFGPGLLSEGNSVTKMIELYLRGKWRMLLGNGKGVGNYAFVEDIAQGHLLAMENGAAGEKYVLGGENVSYNDFFGLVAQLSNRKYRMLHVPAPVALAFSEVEQRRALWLNQYPTITPGWVRTFLADWAFSSAKAERKLGYAITPLAEALKATIAWLEQNQA